mmetsp:Transcript_17320/g.54774  ORF Transcript_17320/g.54774 Transcript_17320/m.54774 type:complete len:338 (+) Transcript_17320:149-1162(+)
MLGSDYVAHVSATTPLHLDFKAKGYDTELPQEHWRPSPQQKRHFSSYRGSSLSLGKTAFNLLLPPLVFAYVSTLLSFGLHFRFPRMVWLMALPALLPAMLALLAARRARRSGAGTRWQNLSAVLFLCAFLAAALFGNTNFWFFARPFFFVDSLKTYSNVDPAELDGVRLMDAGKVHFAEHSRLATDMGMSFTTGWDVYCVAPITTPAGLPSQGSMLAVYDIWAVGLNCCKSSEPGFHCGEYNNPRARAGLRQVGDTQRLFFRLAVQQAEAAYNIRAPHPLFFYWVEDPHDQESRFFETGFESWILANCVHFVGNACAVIAFAMLFHQPPKDSDLPPL